MEGTAEPIKKRKRAFIGVSKENRITIEEYIYYRKKVVNKATKTAILDRSVLCRFARYLGNTRFRDATIEDTQNYFSTFNKRSSKDTNATFLIKFYKWHLKLNKRERPGCLEWYEYESQRDKRKTRDPDAKQKYFIYKDEYDAIIKNETDLQRKALWETFFLSGGRPLEILSMKIKHTVDDGEVVTIILVDSKSLPRKVFLPGNCVYLLKWLEEHPFRSITDRNIWIRPKSKKPLYYTRLRNWFKTALQRAGIEKKYTLKSFRKTRATILFNGDYTDTMIADFMGWEVSMVPFRRREYDLTGEEDLRKKIIGNLNRPPSYNELKRENKQLRENMEDLIKNQVEESLNEKMQHISEMIKSQWYKMKTQPIVEEYITPKNEKIKFVDEPEYEKIQELLEKYLSNKKEQEAIKKLGLMEWSKRKMKIPTS